MTRTALLNTVLLERRRQHQQKHVRHCNDIHILVTERKICRVLARLDCTSISITTLMPFLLGPLVMDANFLAAALATATFRNVSLSSVIFRAGAVSCEADDWVR